MLLIKKKSPLLLTKYTIRLMRKLHLFSHYLRDLVIYLTFQRQNSTKQVIRSQKHFGHEK